MTLSQADQDTINAFNDFAGETTDATLARTLVPWFTNIREFVRANFAPQGIELLERHFEHVRNFVVLGSGPSAPKILNDLYLQPDTVILCGPTGVSSCLVAGIKPDLLFVADSAPEQYTVIRDLDPAEVASWRVALPVTADKAWYAEDSIFKRDQLYFYLPYFSHLGDVDFAYNQIQKTLCPDVGRYLAQAGSVGSAMIMFADMMCGKDPSKRIYLGLDCCGWLTNPPLLRAPDALKDSAGHYAAVTTIRQVKQNAEDAVDALVLQLPSLDIQTNLGSLGYAVQALWLVHSQSADALAQRYALISESGALYRYANDTGDIIVPYVHANEIGIEGDVFASENWAYMLLLKISRILVAHREKLVAKAKEEADAQNESNSDPAPAES
jgi:hypothetical protein